MNDKKLYAGAGAVEIAFPEGYFPTYEHYSRVMDPIHCKALMIEGEGRLCIVSLELPSLKPYSLIDDMKDLVSSLTGYAPEEIWIAMTHNMAAPHVPPADAGDGKFEMHVDAVKNAITAAVTKAKENMREALVGTGNGEAYVNVNRDIETKDGWWLGIEGTGPSDKEVTALRFDDLSGHTIAALFTYACKSSVLEDSFGPDGTRRVSAELSGRACEYVEKRIKAPVLYFMSDGGDQVPKKKAHYYTAGEDGHILEVSRYDEGAGWMDDLAEELGKSVLDTVLDIDCGEMDFMAVTSVDLTYPGQKGVDRSKPDLWKLSYEYIPDEPQTVKFELFCINDLAMIGVKPEITSLTGMQLRRLSPFKHTTVASMVNGGFDYMADASVYDRYLFEGVHSNFRKGAAESFVPDMIDILTKIKNGETA